MSIGIELFCQWHYNLTGCDIVAAKYCRDHLRD